MENVRAEVDFLKWIVSTTWPEHVHVKDVHIILYNLSFLSNIQIFLNIFTVFVVSSKMGVQGYLKHSSYFPLKNTTLFLESFFHGRHGWLIQKPRKFPPRKVTVHFVDPNHGIPRSGGVAVFGSWEVDGGWGKQFSLFSGIISLWKRSWIVEGCFFLGGWGVGVCCCLFISFFRFCVCCLCFFGV